MVLNCFQLQQYGEFVVVSFRKELSVCPRFFFRGVELGNTELLLFSSPHLKRSIACAWHVLPDMVLNWFNLPIYLLWYMMKVGEGYLSYQTSWIITSKTKEAAKYRIIVDMKRFKMNIPYSYNHVFLHMSQITWKC